MISRKFVVDKENTYYYVQRAELRVPYGNREFYVNDGYDKYATLYSAERFDAEFMNYSKYSILAFLEKAYIDITSASEDILNDKERFALCTKVFEIRKKIEKKSLIKPSLVGVYDKFMEVLLKVNEIRKPEDDITLEAESDKSRAENVKDEDVREATTVETEVKENEEFVSETKHERVRK